MSRDRAHDRLVVRDVGRRGWYHVSRLTEIFELAPAAYLVEFVSDDDDGDNGPIMAAVEMLATRNKEER